MHVLVNPDATEHAQADEGQEAEQEATAARRSGFVVTEHVPDAAEHPGGAEPVRPQHETGQGGDPQHRQEHDGLLDGIHVCAVGAFELFMAAAGRSLDAVFAAGTTDQAHGDEKDEDVEQGDEGGTENGVIHEGVLKGMYRDDRRIPAGMPNQRTLPAACPEAQAHWKL